MAAAALPFASRFPADCVEMTNGAWHTAIQKTNIADFGFTISGIHGHRGTAKPVRAAMSSRILAVGIARDSGSLREVWGRAPDGSAASIEHGRGKNLISLSVFVTVQKRKGLASNANPLLIW